MFTDTDNIQGFAAPDVAAARAFYTDVLGIPSDEAHGIVTLHLAGRDAIIYPKPDHEPAGFTILNFQVADIGAAVDELVERGVTITRYDEMPQDERGIMRAGGPFIAWFTDPAGNVLAVLQERPDGA